MRHSRKVPRAARSASPIQIVVGIDPALDAHGLVALANGGYTLDRRYIPNSMAGFQLLHRLLNEWQRQAPGGLTVALEEASAYGHALACYLQQQGWQPLVVDALQVARFKQVFQCDVNDFTDAETVARLAQTQPALAKPAQLPQLAPDPQTETNLRLRTLSRRHACLTTAQTMAVNELHAVLRQAWLADYQRFFSQIHGATALAFWRTYPTPAEAAAATAAQIAALLQERSQGRISASQAREKAQDIHSVACFMQAVWGRNAPACWAAWAGDIRLLAGHVAELVAVRQQVERQMAALLAASQSPLQGWKGLGPVLAAAIQGETLGIERFKNCARFARYNGTAPREDSTGRGPRHVKNQRCNHRLRQAFLQLALQLAKYDQESKAYLATLRHRGLSPRQGRLRLARRVSDIIYALLRDGTRYDHDLYRSRKKKEAA